MSYGTPDQMASLLGSIKNNVSEEPTTTWTHRHVRQASRELADLLYDRLNEPPSGQGRDTASRL